MDKKESRIMFADGGVQGVCYRDFCEKSAEMIGLKGTAENLDNGMVEIHVEGYNSMIDLFIEMLKYGPTSANVTNLTQGTYKYKNEFDDFRILYPVYVAPIVRPEVPTTTKWWNKKKHKYDMKKTGPEKLTFIYRHNVYCHVCGRVKDMEVNNLTGQTMLICVGCGSVFFEGKDGKALSAKPKYAHQPDQYDKGSDLRSDGNCMLHWTDTHRKYKGITSIHPCSCEMCERAIEIMIDANLENIARSATRKPEGKQWI